MRRALFLLACAATICFPRPSFGGPQEKVTPNTVRATSSIDFEDVAHFDPIQISKHPDFDSYFTTRGASSVEGYALEWELINDSRGSASTLTNQKHNNPTDPSTDVVTVDKSGKIVRRWQCKRTLTVNDVAETSYAGHYFFTTEEARKTLLDELIRREASASQRKIQLEPQWRNLRQVFEEDRIPEAFNISGRRLPTYASLKITARRELKAIWDRHHRAMSTRALAKSGKTVVSDSKIHLGKQRLPIRAVAVGAAVAVLAETAVLWYRVDSGELQPADLPEECTRSAIRVAIVAAAEGALLALAATPTGWMIIGVGVAATAAALAVDGAIEWLKREYGRKELTSDDLRDLLPQELHAMLREPTALDRWTASRNGDPDVWKLDWKPKTSPKTPSHADR